MYTRWYAQIENPKWTFTIWGYLHIYGDLRVKATDDTCKRCLFAKPMGIPFKL
jgi:hypothetical protein